MLKTIEKEIKKLGLKNSDILRTEWVQAILEKYKFNETDDLYASIGFGGLSVLLQVLSITSEAKLSIKPYILGKFLQACLSAIIMYFLL